MYIFTYQRGKDRKDLARNISLQEQNIKLQWFKELIVQPHIDEIRAFYTSLHSLQIKLSAGTITDDVRSEVTEFVKTEGSNLRKSFIDVLLSVDSKLHQDIKTNIDSLVDGITQKLWDAGLNLNHKPTFEREVANLISYSHNDLISRMYNYKGV
ncbi:MAG: hypothetical protein ACLQQ4_16690 [Bacteroidia bacterium]